MIHRFDAYIDSPLIRFLLESSLESVRVCHHLYWILKCNINDQTFAYRSRIYLNSLLAIVGESTTLMIDRQEHLCRSLSSICDHVKSAKESQRLNTLLLELEPVNDYLVCHVIHSFNISVYNWISFYQNRSKIQLSFRCLLLWVSVDSM